MCQDKQLMLKANSLQHVQRWINSLHPRECSDTSMYFHTVAEIGFYMTVLEHWISYWFCL